MVIDWSIDRRRGGARASSATSLLELPRSFADRTSISGGIEFAMRAARARAVPGRRAAPSTCPATAPTIPAATCGSARDEALAKGVTINGLVILSDRPMPWNPEHTNPPGGLEKYYRDNVIGGPGAFVMVARGFQSFGQAIVKKMIAEIADVAVAAAGDRTLSRGGSRADCAPSLIAAADTSATDNGRVPAHQQARRSTSEGRTREEGLSRRQGGAGRPAQGRHD